MNALPRLASHEQCPRNDHDRGVRSRASWPAVPSVALPPAEAERAWVTSIRASDASAFEAMFRAYYEPLHAFALGYVRNAAAADDLVQDVLCWVWEHRGTWAVDTSLKTYLFGAVRNRALNHGRRQRIMERWQCQAIADIAIRPETRCAEPADALTVEGDFARALQRAVQRLPARCREAYLLRWAHHLSYKEIASHMAISEKTVEIQITKALKVLRQALTDFF
jgi:RNA polymerase sigma-70 factor (ECF subfamily)